MTGEHSEAVVSLDPKHELSDLNRDHLGFVYNFADRVRFRHKNFASFPSELLPTNFDLIRGPPFEMENCGETFGLRPSGPGG